MTKSKQSVVLVLLFVLPCAILSAEQSPNDPAASLPAPAEGKTWKLVWNDEFDGDAIDTSKWEIIGDHPRRDGFWVKEDAYVDGKGHLVLRTKQDGDRYTSGAVRTMGKYEPRFGYLEARCKMPKEEGHWPAFWLYSHSVGQVGDGGRDGTEIDIMEFPYRDGRIQQALHWDGYGEHHEGRGETPTIPGVGEGFHVFALHWTPTEYIFYVDGRMTWRTNAGGVSQVPAYIKLTVEIGDWAGDIKKAKLPEHFLVDYVRVYQEVGKGE